MVWIVDPGRRLDSPVVRTASAVWLITAQAGSGLALTPHPLLGKRVRERGVLSAALAGPNNIYRVSEAEITTLLAGWE